MIPISYWPAKKTKNDSGKSAVNAKRKKGAIKTLGSSGETSAFQAFATDLDETPRASTVYASEHSRRYYCLKK